MSLTLEQPSATSDLQFHPVTALIDADVTGVDLRDEVDPPTAARLRRALLTHKVLFFRDQPIDDVQQIRFSRYFGAVTPAHPVTNELPDFPEIKVNKLHGGEDEYRSFRLKLEHPFRAVSRARSGRRWHIDITFVANPAAITVLRGVEIPSHGGDTIWADLEALYAGLSPRLQNLLDGLQAIHVRNDAADGNPPPPRFDGRSTGPFAALYPLVRVLSRDRKQGTVP
jgi:alpha-ketoglutarate-dependent sulfate ester dioxygenase